MCIDPKWGIAIPLVALKLLHFYVHTLRYVLKGLNLVLVRGTRYQTLKSLRMRNTGMPLCVRASCACAVSVEEVPNTRVQFRNTRFVFSSSLLYAEFVIKLCGESWPLTVVSCLCFEV